MIIDGQHRVIHVDFVGRKVKDDGRDLREAVSRAVAQMAGELEAAGGEEALALLGQALMTLGAGIVAQVEGVDEVGELLVDLAVALQLEQTQTELRKIFDDEQTQDETPKD